MGDGSGVPAEGGVGGKGPWGRARGKRSWVRKPWRYQTKSKNRKIQDQDYNDNIKYEEDRNTKLLKLESNKESSWKEYIDVKLIKIDANTEVDENA